MGKTTASLSACASYALEGRKTLYIEVGAISHAGPMLGKKGLSYAPTRLAPNLWGCRVSWNEALRDYLLRQVKVERLLDLFLDNKPVRYFFDVAPALRDLMILGKIVHELDDAGAPGPYDVVVVDAPATGHGLFLLRTPAVVQQVTKFGPIFERARHILSAITDSKITRVDIVCLPRPVVVGETLELLKSLRKLDAPLGELIINRAILPEGMSTFREALQLANQTGQPLLSTLARRAALEIRETARLKKLTRLPIRILSELPATDDLNLLAENYQGNRGLDAA